VKHVCIREFPETPVTRSAAAIVWAWLNSAAKRPPLESGINPQKSGGEP